MAKHGKYLFVVNPKATKVDIKNAFRQLYGVPASKVNIVQQTPKTRMVRRGLPLVKRKPVKRAIITTKGQKTVDVYKQ
ncbi:MAG: 50S ribosomal protein L23 [Candidatus Peregrinibacteria bacterium GW2011_GWA2_47_7]|nr:MAG: 50S ribosomal protein L23 [Candidatus Peregrinibacteria bacterium GW2011_GWA2_47_7]